MLYVSHVTKEFNDRHVWVDGKGRVVTPPETRVVETQKYATLVSRPVKSMQQRAREREEFSLNLWKNINPAGMDAARRPRVRACVVRARADKHVCFFYSFKLII